MFNFLLLALLLTAQPAPTIADAIAARDAGRFTEAAELFAAIAADQPANALAIFNHAYCVHATGDFARAIPLHQAAANFPQTRPAALYNLACAHARLAHADDAFEALRLAARAGTRDPTQFENDPDLAPLHPDPRWPLFLDELREMNRTAPETALNFWVGHWTVTDAATGKPAGHNTLTLRNNGTVIHEQWTGLGPNNTGESWNYFDPAESAWVQIWIDPSGAVTRFLGHWRDGAMHFEGTRTDRTGLQSRVAMIVRPIDNGQVRQTGTALSPDAQTQTTRYDLIYQPAAASPADPADQPDPSVRLSINPPPTCTPEPELAARLGAHRVYQTEDHNRFVISFTPAKGTHADLNAALERHAANANAELLNAVPGKHAQPIDPSPADPFRAAALPSVWFAYPTGPGADAICDSAAVFAATPAGIWTISWNAPIGRLEDANASVTAFLHSISITRQPSQTAD